MRLLIKTGRLNNHHIGKIKFNGGLATIEITNGRADHLAHRLGRHLIEMRHIYIWEEFP